MGFRPRFVCGGFGAPVQWAAWVFRFVVSSKRPEGARDVTFTLDQAGHTYEDGNIGLKPTSLTITPESKRVAVIGLNGSGKTTLLQLLDGALAATSGSVRIDADGVAYDPSVKRDLKRIESMIGRVRREEIPNSYYKADSIREAIDEPLKKHKVPKTNVRRLSAICLRISIWLRSRASLLPRWTARSAICWRLLPH